MRSPLGMTPCVDVRLQHQVIFIGLNLHCGCSKQPREACCISPRSSFQATVLSPRSCHSLITPHAYEYLSNPLNKAPASPKQTKLALAKTNSNLHQPAHLDRTPQIAALEPAFKHQSRVIERLWQIPRLQPRCIVELSWATSTT